MNNLLNSSIVYNIDEFLGYNKVGVLKFVCKNIEPLLRHYKYSINSVILNKNLYEWFLDYYEIDNPNINVIFALKNNYTNVLYYLKNNWNKFTVKKAIQYSNFKTIKFLLDNKCEINRW